MSARVYVGTYNKYNNGDLSGKWMNLEDYKNEEAFYEAARELHKDEEDPELMFQDFEGFPKQYYDESSLPDALWDWLELSDHDKELLEVYQEHDTDGDIKKAQEAFMGKFDSEKDWAYEFIEDVGINADTLNSYLIMSDTDARLLANDFADSYTESMDDEELVKEAGLEDEYEVEEDEGKKEKIVQQAKEKVAEEHSDEVERQLKKDPVGYLVDDQGIYTVEELAKQNFIQIDYEAFARDARLGGDVDFIRKDGEVWVFSSI